MPELPEIEHLRRTLEPRIIGAAIGKVELRRRDVAELGDLVRPRATLAERSRGLLQGGTVKHITRLGKQLAIIVDDGRALCAHMGMSGQLRFLEGSARPELDRHAHCLWALSRRGRTQEERGWLVFRDPRRFGGLWGYRSLDALRTARWSALGPDALTIDAKTLGKVLHGRQTPIKAALLNQKLLAGVGNIYADESLHKAGIHPVRPAHSLSDPEINRMALAIRTTLAAAIAKGGSTIRSYADVNGQSGRYASLHLVYGRAGQLCTACSSTLLDGTIGQRTTVWCPECQPEA